MTHSKSVGWVLPVLLLCLWEWSVASQWVSAHLLPPPTEIVLTLWDLLTSGQLPAHLLASGGRVASGFLIGASLAILVGAWVGLNPRVEAFIDPTFQALRAIPSLAWVPLLLLWLGIDELPKITLIALGAFFPVYLNWVAGIHNVDRKWVELAKISGLNSFQMVHRVFIPAALPNLFTGVRNGLSLSWMFLVAAELIAASRGLGYLMTDGRETGRADLVIVSILILAALGKISDSGVVWTEKRLLSWRDVYSNR